MFAAHGGESQQHVKAGCGLLLCRREGCEGISVFGIPAWSNPRAVNMQASNILVAIGLRQGNPEMVGPRDPRWREHAPDR